MARGGTIKGCSPLTELEIAQLARFFRSRHGGRDLAFFMVGVTTGFRVSELLSLTVGDVANGEPDRLRKWVQVPRQHMKGQREGRRMPLHPQARSALAAWVAELRRRGHGTAETPLFVSRKRRPDGALRPISTAQAGRIMQEGCRAIGHEGPGGTHSMRKTIAVKTYRATGGDYRKVQQVLGHQSVSSTEHYLPPILEDEMEQLVGGLSFGAAGPLFEEQA